MANDINKEDPHYKGEYGSIYEVNRKFPTGGVAGDFVVIEGWAHYWNADRGTWCVNAERDSYWDELITNIIEKFKLVRGATYMGVASLNTEPAKAIGAKMYYFATVAGTYKNFDNLVVPQGINVLYSENGSSWVNTTLLEVAQELGVSTNKVVSQKTLNDALNLKANQSSVNEALAKKADNKRVDDELAKKFDKASVVQEFGDSEDKVVSQFALPFREIESPEFIKAIVDAEDHFLFGIQLDGSIEWGKGIPAPIRAKLQEIINQCQQDKTDILEAINAAKKELSASIAALQEGKVDKEEGKSLIEDEVKECFRVIENEEFLKAIVDSEDKVLFGFYRATGKPYYPLNEMYHVEQNKEFFAVWLDAANHVLLGIRRDGQIIGEIHAVNALKQVISQLQADVAALQKKVGTIDTNLKELLDVFSLQDNEEYLAVEQDAEGKILSSTNPDGSHYIHNVKSETIPEEFSHIEDPEKRIHIITDADEKVLTAIDELGTEHNFLKQKYHNDVDFYKDVYINGVKYKPSRFYGNTIFVAASDSSDIDKKFADYVCDGINDEYEINKAIEDIGKCGTVFLFSGNFHIDSFGEHKGFEKSAIVVKDIGTYRSVLIKGIRHYYNGTNIVVSQKAFDAISQDEQPCVFNCLSPINNGEEPWYGAFWYVSLQDMFISIPTWKRKCIVVNLRNVGCGEEKNLRISAFGNNQYGEYCPTDYANEDTPEGLVGITGMHGWTYGDTTRYDNISVWGMHEAFQLGGEHLICNSLRARYNYCAYTFGNYKNSLSYGAFDHPLTLINCCDEKSTQGPIFAWNGLAARKDWNIIPDRKMQGITFIDFNTESYKYGAYEVEPGSFCGRIDYHYSDGVYGAFSNRNFWANGSGKKFITHDETHQDGGNTALRNSYRPNYMQRYFDTDLNKELICVNPSSKKWVDTNGTVVSQSNPVKQTGKLKDNTELLNKQITFKSVYDDSEYTITSENGKWDTTLYPDSYEIKVEGYEILPNVLEVTEAKSDIELLAKKTYLVSGTISIERFNNFKLAFIDSDGKKYQTTILNKNFAINLKNGDYSIELQCTELNIKKCTINNNNVNLGQIV